MARRRSGKRRDVSQYILWGLSLVVALSMVLAYCMQPPSQPARPTPTPLPSPTPMSVPPTPTATLPLPAPSPVPRPQPTETPQPALPPVTSPTPTETVTPVPSPLTPTPTPIALDLGEQFTFAVCGDSRDGDAIYRRVLEAVQADGSAFFIHLGDIVPRGRESEWLAWRKVMAGFTLPFFPVPGNHDSPDGLLDEYLRYSGAPAQRYSFDIGPLHLVMLDSYSGAIFPSTLRWLEEDLAGTEQPVKMLFFHHPPFDPDGTDHILQMGNAQVMNLAERYGVQYVFTGHIHAYEEAERNGVRYIISGGCGAPLYASEHPDGAFYHYVRVHVDGIDVSTEVVRIEP